MTFLVIPEYLNFHIPLSFHFYATSVNFCLDKIIIIAISHVIILLSYHLYGSVSLLLCWGDNMALRHIFLIYRDLFIHLDDYIEVYSIGW